MNGNPADRPERRPLVKWRAILAVAAALLLFGLACRVNVLPTRVAAIAGSLGIWVATAVLLRRHATARIAVLVLPAGALVWLLLPGHGASPDVLRSAYVARLRAYEGTRTLWGGENGLGFDCSGYVRRSLIDADVLAGLRRANPCLVRQGLSLGWFDCSARALKDGYRDLTVVVEEAVRSLNEYSHTSAQPGDVAVTSDGHHSLAYLGDRTWIHATSDVGCVARERAGDSADRWFVVPITVVRWKQLTAEPRPSPRSAQDD